MTLGPEFGVFLLPVTTPDGAIANAVSRLVVPPDCDAIQLSSFLRVLFARLWAIAGMYDDGSLDDLAA